MNICPYYKAAILAGRDFTFPFEDGDQRELEAAIRQYATCDGVACEHAVIRVDRDGKELKTVFVRCGRREQ